MTRVVGNNVLFQFFITGQALRELMSGAVAGTGITQDEYAVLGAISALRSVTPSELAAELSMPPTTISRYIATFVERGLAVRVPNPGDRRSYEVRTTAEGQRVVRTVAPRVRGLVEALGRESDIPLPDLQGSLVHLERIALALINRREN